MMTMSYRFGDVDTHGAPVRVQAMALAADYQAILRDVLAAGDFWRGAGSSACQGFITELGRNFQVTFEQANTQGSQVQSAGSHLASTDSTVGSSWA
jgi:Proteins of 100 residues with WXG